MMSDYIKNNRVIVFDHEKLHVYQAGLEFVAFAAVLAKELKGEFRSTRDQLIRSSQSIVLNIAEGNGKHSDAECKRFFEIAWGSAMESAATLDVIVACGITERDAVARENTAAANCFHAVENDCSRKWRSKGRYSRIL